MALGLFPCLVFTLLLEPRHHLSSRGRQTDLRAGPGFQTCFIPVDTGRTNFGLTLTIASFVKMDENGTSVDH